MTSRMWRRGLVISAGLLAFIALGCGGKSQEELVIGEYGSLTGGEADFGQSTKRGVELAMAELDSTQKGMIGGLKPYPAMKGSGVPCLGEVPDHWAVQRIKTLFREKDERNGSSDAITPSAPKRGRSSPSTTVTFSMRCRGALTPRAFFATAAFSVAAQLT